MGLHSLCGEACQKMSPHISFKEVFERLVFLSRHLPELACYDPVIRIWQAQENWPTVSELNAFLGPFVNRANSGAARPLQFIEQTPQKNRVRRRAVPNGLPGGKAFQYVHSIEAGGSIPTRLANLHDFAGALTWALFPQTKRVLFRYLHADYLDFYETSADQAIQAWGMGGRGRGLKADRLTVLDESGVLLFSEANHGLDRVVFGHGLIEQLVQGGPAVHAPSWTICASGNQAVEAFDGAAADGAAAVYFDGFLQNPNPAPNLATIAVDASVFVLPCMGFATVAAPVTAGRLD